MDIVNQYRCINDLWDNLFGMTGFVDVATKFFIKVPSSTDEVRKNYLSESIQFVDQIFDCKPGEIGQIGHAALMTKLVAQGYLNE